jgi:hypothetical protein
VTPSEAETFPHRVLVIAYVWPEPRSSAAGVRTEQLINDLRQAGGSVTVASASKQNEASAELEAKGIRCVPILLNDSSFNVWMREEKFDFVLFDRFISEEQFGWRVLEASPQTVRIMDSSDLHFLRRTRQKALKNGAPLSDIFSDRLDFLSDDAFREVASIYRCDLTLLVSDHECALLRERFELAPHLLKHLPIGYPAATLTGLPGFSERRGFATIGNFRHPPNADGNRWLKKEIWPRIRAALPHAEMHIYGAYPAREDMGLTDPSQGFYVKGPVPNALEALTPHRVILAPLRFGAGIKGKIADAWRSGAPVVTTPIGAEGMSSFGRTFGGSIAGSVEYFAKQAVLLHESAEHWESARRVGVRTLAEQLNAETLGKDFIDSLLELKKNLHAHRSKSFISRVLSQQAFQGTKYFSKWIEAKSLLENSAAQIDLIHEGADDDRVSATP